MLPKRKLIKKSHRRPEEPEEEVSLRTGSIVESLHSRDPNSTEQALVYISSMCSCKDLTEMIPLLAQMVAILIRGPTSSVYQCLYALSNLIDLEPSIVPQLFQLGLSKALTQLNSNDNQLLKPILTLMTSLHGILPSEYQYLQSGVSQSLNLSHLESSSKVQVLLYLCRIGTVSLSNEMYQKLFQIFKNQEKLSTRALCVCILMNNNEVLSKISKDVLEFCEEILCDIDLQKEYTMNIVKAKPAEKGKDIVETDMIDQQEEIIMHQHPNVEVFNDTVEAKETLLEGILTLFQTEDNEEIQQEQECDNQDWDKEIEAEKIESNSNNILVPFLHSQFNNISKNTLLSFPQGQNIVCLSLRLLSYCKGIDKEALAILIMKCFENMLKVKPDLQIQQEILVIGLHLLLQCPLPPIGREMLIVLGQNVLKVSESYKECWLRLLELFSTNFNPQKCFVSPQENKRVGAILINLIINIPELKLEEWRGQAIDTVFDVFSNQQFDAYLVQTGLLGLLEKVIASAGGGKKKKFVKDVITDIQRFLEYKKKMIKL